jgi:uncharacterized protein GlcG (DUF336 family)
MSTTALTLQQARTILDGACASARKHAYKPMGFVVVDAAGLPVATAREDGASALRLDIALGKACAAVGMGCNSRALALRTKDVPIFLASVASTSTLPFIPQTGAALIVDAHGQILGAAGASGGTGDEDEAACVEGIVAAGLKHTTGQGS